MPSAEPLERRHRVHHPAEAADALVPVEAAGVVRGVALLQAPFHGDPRNRRDPAYSGRARLPRRGEHTVAHDRRGSRIPRQRSRLCDIGCDRGPCPSTRRRRCEPGQVRVREVTAERDQDHGDHRLRRKAAVLRRHHARVGRRHHLGKAQWIGGSARRERCPGPGRRRLPGLGCPDRWRGHHATAPQVPAQSTGLVQAAPPRAAPGTLPPPDSSRACHRAPEELAITVPPSASSGLFRAQHPRHRGAAVGLSAHHPPRASTVSPTRQPGANTSTPQPCTRSLLGDTPLPTRNQLPADISYLARSQFWRITLSDSDTDIADLVQLLARASESVRNAQVAANMEPGAVQLRTGEGSGRPRHGHG